jgi:hypothetical protein
MGPDQLVASRPPVLPRLPRIGLGANLVVEVGDPASPVEQCRNVRQGVVWRGDPNVVEGRGSDPASLATASRLIPRRRL